MRGATIRRTWDRAARSGGPKAIGSIGECADDQVDLLFTLLGARPHGQGSCLEVGCGVGRMTAVLAQRWPRVMAVDVSPEMLARAQALNLPNVRYGLVSGERLDGVPSGYASTLVCYAVIQHLPSRRLIGAYLAEFERALAPDGEAIVQLPLLPDGLWTRAWRFARSVATVLNERLPHDFTADSAYRGARVTERELLRMLARAGLSIAARADIPGRFSHAANVLLRLRRCA